MVLRRDRAAARVPAIEMTKLYGQSRRLQGVQATVSPAVAHGVVLVCLAVAAELPYGPCDLLVPGDDGAPVTERAEVLGRIETEGRGVAHRAGTLPAIRRPMRLRAVFDDF